MKKIHTFIYVHKKKHDNISLFKNTQTWNDELPCPIAVVEQRTLRLLRVGGP